MLDAHNGHSIEQRAKISSSLMYCSSVKLCTERVHSVTFFAPVCPSVDETGKDLLASSIRPFPKPLDVGQGVEHEVRAEMEFQRFLAYDLSGTVNG